MKLTEEEKDEIYSMYLSGKYYITEIAEWIGCHPCTVAILIRKMEKKYEKKYTNRRKVN